jgi:predicted DNA-binding transcriptional regulator YafY
LEDDLSASRLLSMLILLQLRGQVTAAEFAAQFEISVRTVYRDIDHLSGAGVPVYAERGRNGGFRLLDGYQTRLTGMTAQESEALQFAGLKGPAGALGLGAALDQAQLKMLAALPADKRAGARQVAERFHLDPVEWYRRADPPDRLPAIAHAVWEDRVITIRYESWRDIVERTLHPLGLVLKDSAWYLVASSGGQPRTYRVSNIQDLTVGDRGFERPAKFDLAAYWSAWVHDFEARIYQDEARIRASPAGLSRLRRLSAAVDDAVGETARPSADGWANVRIPIEGIEQAASALLALGPEIIVAGPAPLRRRIAELADGVARLYDKTRAGS